MRDLRSIVDRVEIEALRGEFTDAGMTHDHDRFAALFTEDGVWRIPAAGIEFTSRAAIRAGRERLHGGWEFFVQTIHPGIIQFDGDPAREAPGGARPSNTASGRSYVAELGRLRDGGSHQNYAVYHDRYRRTPDGWRFTERVYQVRYLDTTPLAGSAPT